MPAFTATYSPEDNKLRLYATSRLDTELYARAKSAGFSWAPRQQLFVAPMWCRVAVNCTTRACRDVVVTLIRDRCGRFVVN
jgi:hypothetical protein